MVIETPPDFVAAEGAMVGAPEIRLKDVTAGYWQDRPVLKNASLNVTGCGWWHLSGPNGSGKSTLFEVLAGHLRPMSGIVSVGGAPVRTGDRVVPLRVQRADPAFVPGITLRDHLHLYAGRYQLDLSDLAALAIRLGLGDHLDKTPEALSTGSLRKAWFVCHTAGREPIWCLDEPFNGVDTESVAVMASHLAHQSVHRLIFLTSHLLPSVMHTADEAPETMGPFTLRRGRYV